MYNSDLGHVIIFQRRLEGARNHNICVDFDTDIKMTELQRIQPFFFRDIIEGLLLRNTSGGIEGEKVLYGYFPVFIGVRLMISTIKGPPQREFWSNSF